MSRLDFDGIDFYKYAMELFSKAGHIFTSEPEFANHSPEQFVYFDSKSEISLSQAQRMMLKLFNNVSRLFTVNGCAFFSVNLLTAQNYRSQTAHDLHTMIHPLIGEDATICLFRYDDEIIMSFIGYGNFCILSDWYPISDDHQMLLNKLDIANISIQSGAEYFADMIYNLARSYYLVGCESTIYDLIPVDFIYTELDREDLDLIVRNILSAPEREYGDDYVKYDETAGIQQIDINVDFDLMLLEMDIEDDNPFGEEFEDSEYVDNEFFDGDGNGDELEQDIYEFDNVDPEIFRDPALMVKWLKRQENRD